MQIYSFNNILKPVLWGGNQMTAFKGLPPCDEPIGESWEISGVPGRESVVAEGPDKGLTLTELVQRYGAQLVGEDVFRRFGTEFPLLIKFIDARRDLSVQVHPDDELAMKLHGCEGKTEMWYILRADEGAKIRAGFNRPMSPEEYDARVEDGSIIDVIAAHDSKPGAAFFIPAGQIHCIGAGNMLVEIQQSSDITYRVWDYARRDANGNLRQLHTQQAREALNYDVVESEVHYGPAKAMGVTPVVSCSKFDVCHIDVDGRLELPLPAPHSFIALMCIEGETTVMVEGMDPVTLPMGHSALVPATVSSIQFTGTARLLTAMVPVNGD